MATTAAGPAADAGSAWRWLGPLLALALVLAPGVFWSGQVLDEEAVGFLQKNWSERGALQKIFDVRGWDYYQGRELSYAIDYLDGLWVRLLLSRGVTCFVPPSAVLASLGFVWIGRRLAPRALPRLPAAWRWLALFLLLSSFVSLTTMGLLYRATKPLVAPLVLALLLVALAEHREPRLGPRSAFAVSLLLTLTICLLDRQGLFYALALLAALTLHAVRARRLPPLALGVVAGLAVFYFYFAFVGPRLIHALEGYWPQTRFQRLRPERLLQPELWRVSADVLADWTRVLLGDLPAWLLATAAAVAVILWLRRARPRTVRLALAVSVAVGIGLGQWAMVATMLERHPPIAWLSHRLWYYPFPYQAVFVFGVWLALDRLAASGATALQARAVSFALASLVLLNLVRWPEKRAEIAAEASFAEKLQRSFLLVRSLHVGRAQDRLDSDHRRFYFDCLDLFPALAARASAQVSEGEGVGVTELRAERLVARAERTSHLAVRTRQAGAHVLAGSLRLRAGDSVSVLLGSTRPRLLGQVRRAGSDEGIENFRLRVDLPAGVSDLLLVSELPPVPQRVEGRRYDVAFTLLLPVLVWAEPAAAPSTHLPTTFGLALGAGGVDGAASLSLKQPVR